MVFPSQDNVTSTKSSSNFRLPRAATMFFWKLFHFKQKCSCGIATFAVLVCVNVCVWVNLPLGNLLKAFDQKLHSIVELCGVFYSVYFKHKPIILFLYFIGLMKETYNWKMSSRVQRKALKFECDELKKSFHKKKFLSTSDDSELM